MRCGVVASRTLALRVIDLRMHSVTGLHKACSYASAMDDETSGDSSDVLYLDPTVGRRDHARVGHLPTALGIKGRLLEKELDVLPLLDTPNLFVMGDEGDHLSVDLG